MLTRFDLLKTAYGPKHAKNGVHLYCPVLCLTIIVSEVPGSKASVSKDEVNTSVAFEQDYSKNIQKLVFPNKDDYKIIIEYVIYIEVILL